MMSNFVDFIIVNYSPSFNVNENCPSFVRKLQKSLYGLKHTSYIWFQRLSYVLLQLGFVCSKTDSFIFFSRRDSTILYILIDVNGNIFTGFDQIAAKFSIRDLGLLHYFLG